MREVGRAHASSAGVISKRGVFHSGFRRSQRETPTQKTTSVFSTARCAKCKHGGSRLIDTERPDPLDWRGMTGTRVLRSDEPLAVELTAALKQGEVDRLDWLLAANPGLAHCVVENAKATGERRCIFSPIGRGTIRMLSRLSAPSLRLAPTSMRRRSGCGTARRHYIGRPATTMWG